MTLVNMRENGVRLLCVTCELCHHDALMNVDTFDDAIPVRAWSAPRVRDRRCIFAHACKLGLEGIVSKHRDHPYRSGHSKTWLKVKNPSAPAF
jgi:hypothetical protein